MTSSGDFGTSRPAAAEPVLEVLEREECLALVAPGGIGRVAFNGSHGPTVLPVNYKFHDGAIVFRTSYGGPMDQDLRTGVQGVDILIGFQVDRIDGMKEAFSRPHQSANGCPRGGTPGVSGARSSDNDVRLVSPARPARKGPYVEPPGNSRSLTAPLCAIARGPERRAVADAAILLSANAQDGLELRHGVGCVDDSFPPEAGVSCPAERQGV
ncbi:pyridoxamine 5'-phosphate oxidase family protein [Nonomuraea sp. NPDC049480]|uniref:pyridoxamine 5'-phosphate oxidase family protein n=1 Tax=Nonomuraea sp. NPDC049480 TaxID=3364353 RepID=UPI0037BD3B73